MQTLLADKIFLQKFNKIMIWIVLGVLVFFGIIVVRSGSSFRNSDYSLVQDNITLNSSATLRDIEAYKKIVSSRELFRPFVLSKKKQATVKTIDDITKDLILVGVVSVDNKEAIIKNRRTRQTYFVSVGSRIGEIKVEDISDDKIEVSYKQERKMLFLR